jgi:signal transduction histidine kinase
VADFVVIAGLALLAAVAVAAVGGGVLFALRGSRLRWLLAVSASIPVLAAVGGIWLVADAMFISSHDLRVAIMVLAVAALVGVTLALLAAQLVARGSTALGKSAGSVGSAQGYQAPQISLPKELAMVAGNLSNADVRLREAAARESALEVSRRELVAWVSHDLRSPLAALRAMAEALEDGVVTRAADVARYHAGIRAEADRMAVMIDDLFELSRIHAGALRLAVGRVGLDELVSEAVAIADPLARFKGVRLAGSAESGVPLDVDAREIGRVLRNLVTNAIRHTPSDGAVEIIGTRRDGQAIVVVADSCGGIPESDLDRVFEVAFRGETARTPSSDGGAGLGLAIARGIVEAHDGAIGVRNADGGCRFEVRLPLAAAPAR